MLIQQYDVLVERGLGLPGGDQSLGQNQAEQNVVRAGLDRLAQRGDPVVRHAPHFRLIILRTSGGATHEYTQNPNQPIATTNASGPRPTRRNP